MLYIPSYLHFPFLRNVASLIDHGKWGAHIWFVAAVWFEDRLFSLRLHHVFSR